MKEAYIERLYECNRHAKTIQTAKKHIANQFPLDIEDYRNIGEMELSFIDQMVYRFSKLQDTMGEKIFPSLLTLLGESVKNKPFIDRLNRLEELELLEMQTWMHLRKVRNDISLEYSFNLQEVVDNLNDIFTLSETLIEIYEEIFSFSKQRFDFIKKSDLLS